MTKAPLLLALAPLAVAQFYNISTIAGIGRIKFVGSGGAALNARLIQPTGVAADAAGNIYVSDPYYQQVFQISAGGIVTVYAGNGLPGFSGDGGPAAAAQLFNPGDLVVDAVGNLYICDFTNSRVRKVSPAGTISTVAGSGRGGADGDGGSATAAALGSPHGVALDVAGNLYISQALEHVVRKVSPSGVITTVAGNGAPGYSGDGGPALSAMLSHPHGIKVDAGGNLFIADNYNHRVRKVTPQGTISTFAGNGTSAFRGDGNQAALASLFYPTDIVIDANGSVYIADATNVRVRVVRPSGIINTFAGGGTSLANGPALQALLQTPTAIAIDSQGNIVFPLPYNRQVRRVSPLPEQLITTVAGVLPTAGFGDGVPASQAPLLDPHGIAVDSAGNVYVADEGDNRVRKISPERIISTVAGNGLFGSTGDRGLGINAQVGNPRAVGLDPAGNVYFTSPIAAAVRRVTPGGLITTFAGGTGVGFSGDGGPAAAAFLNVPLGVVGDAQGNVYISDAGSARLRRVNSSGTISTFAGTGVEGFSGDNAPATQARIYQPRQLALDARGNLYVADRSNHRVRKIALDGTITTVAGNGTMGFSGDGGQATAAQVGNPSGITVDAAGNLFVATGARVRKVDATTGVITTIAGTGAEGFSGDGGLATLATLGLPLNLAVDAAGSIYVTDQSNQRVRQLTPVQIVREAVANAASFTTGAVAPGEIVTIFGGPGVTLGPASGAGLQLDASGRVATQIGGVQALFDGVAAPLTFVNASQINAVVPYEVAGKATTQLQVMSQGRPTNTVTLPVAASSPGVFAITNQDGSVNTTSNPSASDGALVVYGTGEGRTDPPVATGTVNASVFPKPLLPVSVQIGGQEATILYVGAAPGFVAGVLQVNIQIPAGVSGTVPLQIRVGNTSTPPALLVSVRAP